RSQSRSPELPSVLPGQPLGEFVEQLLLALVLRQPCLIQIALYQFAQPFQARVALLPELPRLVQVVAIPVDALTLLADGGFQLGEKSLVIHQPLAGDALTPCVEPLLLVVVAIALQLAELGFGLAQRRLAAAE